MVSSCVSEVGVTNASPNGHSMPCVGETSGSTPGVGVNSGSTPGVGVNSGSMPGVGD